jgi:Outer membrane protein beta-barrel domain
LGTAARPAAPPAAQFNTQDRLIERTLVMKRLLLIGLGLSLFAVPSRAQSVDASVGYSYFHVGSGADLNQNGISGSLDYNINHYFGVAGDVGGYHASPGGVSVNTYTYMFGPRIMARNPTKVTPFFQFLIGGAHLTAAGTPSSNNLAYSFGGGVDLGVLPHLAIRPQVDYVGIHSSGNTTNCARVSISAVVHF